MSTTKLPLDSNYDLEQQFILRMTDVRAAENLAADVESGVSFKDNFTMEFEPDMRHATVRYNDQVYQGRMMDLPCIMESLKTTDRNSFYKTSDICQMMICTQGEDSGPLRGTAAYLDVRARSNRSNALISKLESREYQFLHGITPPLKNVLRRRFRKSRQKRPVDMPKIEKEVKQLLRADLQSTGVKWEVIWSDNQSVGDPHDPTANPSDPRPGEKNLDAADDDVEEDDDGVPTYAIDRRDVFGELSSSSADSTDSSQAGSDDERSGSKQSASMRLNPFAQMDTTANSSILEDSFEATAIKDDLAAELLLSDSGDDDDDYDDDNDDEDPPQSDALRQEENDLQASLAAQLAAASAAGSEDDEVVHELDDDEECDLSVQRGGELLDEATLMGLTQSAELGDSMHYDEEL